MMWNTGVKEFEVVSCEGEGCDADMNLNSEEVGRCARKWCFSRKITGE